MSGTAASLLPDDLAEQINWVHQACEAMGVPILTARGYEADDVIGTMATRAEAQEVRVLGSYPRAII